MKNKSNYTADFYDGGIFHVYNRTNNKELLFKLIDNRLYFLKQFQKYFTSLPGYFLLEFITQSFSFFSTNKKHRSDKKIFTNPSFTNTETN